MTPTQQDAPLMIVDDDPTAVDLLRRILKQAGYRRILGVTDPGKVHDLIIRHSPTLILLDLNMPDIDGFEVLRDIRDRIPPANAPLALIMTATDDRESRLRALQLGARDYIVKPYDPPEILLRVRNLLEIQSKNRLFGHLLDSTPAAMLAHDTNGICTFVNRSALILLGYQSADDLIGLDVRRLIFDDPRDHDPNHRPGSLIITETHRGTPVYRPVIRMLHGDGSVFFAEYWAYPVSGVSGQGRVLVTFFDIGERLASERDQRLASRVFESVDRALLITDADGRIVSANPAYTQLTGWTREELIGKNPSLRASGRHGADFYQRMWQGLLEHGGWEGEIWNLRKDGGCYLEELSITTVRDADGVITNYVGTARDLTKDRLHEDELREARKRADAANQAKSRFVANMSHEIRTPLTAIIGYAENLSETQGLSTESAESVDTIFRNGRYLLELVNDILDFSKIEADRLEIEQIETSLPDLLAGIVALGQDRVREKGLEFQFIVEPPWPRTLVTDPTRAGQILINLIGNAIKFTERGWVRLRIRLDRDREQLVCAVEDSGIGIEASRLAQIFDAFVQADASTARTHGGSGLGLTIAKMLARQLGGDLVAESTLGQGSVFTATLATGPLANVALEQDPHLKALDSGPARQAPADAVPRLTGWVLLAEDNKDNRRLIRFLVESTGASVVEAENGEQAVERAQQQPFHLVLMDMQMPVMDGLEATGLLRLTAFDGPILALTANATKHDRQAALDAGCTGFLTKPIQRDKFFAALADHLPEGGDDQEPSPGVDHQPIHFGELQLEFERGLPARLADLSRAAAARDYPLLASLAHQLKGVAASFGRPEATRIAGQLERAALRPDPATIAFELDALEKQCRQPQA